MNTLITGRGASGSFQIRGVQIGAALGARVVPNASADDMAWADVVIAVKRIPGDLLHRIRASGKPWVYDVVDAFPQPECVAWSEKQAAHWVQTLMAGFQPDAVIWPTAYMQSCAPYLRGKVIHHHHRPGIKVNPIRPTIKTVGYEGRPEYLGEWKPAFEKACADIGAKFVINPPHLADLDVCIAVRGRAHRGWTQQFFKSNVKLANAQGSGTPIIAQMDAGYLEHVYLHAPVCWITKPDGIAEWLKILAPQSMRQEISKRLLAQAYTVEDAARDYRAFLQSIVKTASTT